MRTNRFLLWPTFFLTAASLISGLAHAQDAAGSLLIQAQLEAELLDKALERYVEARQLERAAIDELRTLNQRQDALLRDDNRQIDQLRRVEKDVLRAGEVAIVRLRQSAALRQELYNRWERLDGLRDQIAALGGRLVRASGLTGLWQVELEPTGVFGLVRFNADGTLVTGSYRLSDNAQGSLRGTIASNRLELEQIDADGGFVATLRGQLNPVGGLIEGSWLSVDVSGGAPQSGEWTGRKLSAAGSVRLEN